MKTKHHKIKVTKDAPYKFDVLSRKKDVDSLSLLLTNISSPTVLSINASWGEGKTTFMEMLKVNLDQNNCKTLTFSAWETDFSCDPLLAFLGEMDSQITSLIGDDNKKAKAWKAAKAAGSHILKRTVPVAIKLGTLGIVDDKVLEKEAANLTSKLSTDLIDKYSEEKDAINNFKKNIIEVLTTDSGDQTKLYILIDELDRCRPTYSIEFLERIKHILEIEGLVFVLAMDKLQLSHSINAIYGHNFDSLNYLKRFIDIEYLLPKTNIRNFIEQLSKSYDFHDYFETTKNHKLGLDSEESLVYAVTAISTGKGLSLREIEHLFTKINLAFLSSYRGGPEFLKQPIYTPLLVYLIYLKEYHKNVYDSFILNDITCEKPIKILIELIPNKHDGNNIHFINAMIEICLIMANQNEYRLSETPQIIKHKEVMNRKSDSFEYKYACIIIKIARMYETSLLHIDLKSIARKISLTNNFYFT